MLSSSAFIITAEESRGLQVVSMSIEFQENFLCSSLISRHRCSPLQVMSDVVKILACGCTLILLVVCSWAMFDRSKVLLSVFGCIALALEGIDGVYADWCLRVRSTFLCKQPSYSFHKILPIKRDSLNQGGIANFISQIGFDSIVMFLVVYNAFCAVAFERSIKALKRRSLANLILYDGLIYYCTIFAASLAHVLLSFVSPFFQYNKVSAINLTTQWATSPFKQAALPFIQPLSAVITARFLLNMRCMGVYPNGTRTMALTTMDITVDWHVQAGKFDKEKDMDGDVHIECHQDEAESLMSFGLDTESGVQMPRQAVVRGSATSADLSQMLGQTFRSL
ncbi:hypothetical protein BU17DRAFT_64615 [Hysterangium stoloniferum]|nr:hypothetical protein BU17DRAFT_64615 [Hysterangium stoloniferum]